MARSLTVLKTRRDFLACSRARRAGSKGLNLQARQRGADEAPDDEVRVGFTCSKKVGNAVARNRAKRRLRAVASDVLPRAGKTGWDYVLIGRPETTASRPFTKLLSDLEDCLERIHAPAARERGAA
ncbi:MAG: ribonuclease P protein component [Pseudomonadota bacterium]